jgi:hypothetical protein
MAEEFLIGIGGPFYRVERATHLQGLRRIILAAIGITWVPLLVLSLAERLIMHRGELMLRDLSVHARLLVTLPLLLVAERLLAWNCGDAVARVFGEGFIPAAQQGRARAILRSAERWRDSSVPETILLVLAVGSGIASLLGILPPAGLVHGVVESRYSMVRTWYALISLPISQFVLWRSLFRWALWVRVLGGLARIPLRLLPPHADRRGGIGFLKLPSTAYGAVLLLGLSSALCGGWGTQILLYGTKVDALKPLFVAFVLVGAIIAFAPLLAFFPQLLLARYRGRLDYGDLVSDYSRQFQERWIERRERADLLGNADFQSLSDIGNSYRENVEQMQPLLFNVRDCILLLVAAMLPAVPILLLQFPAKELLKRLLHLVTGGMPG